MVALYSDGEHLGKLAQVKYVTVCCVPGQNAIKNSLLLSQQSKLFLSFSQAKSHMLTGFRKPSVTETNELGRKIQF